jgi:orotate phosphoribosyltransferase
MPKTQEELLKILTDCGGFYECPKAADGTRLGPLVAYAGKYDGEHHFVGDVYCNMAKVEAVPVAITEFVRTIALGLEKAGIRCDKVIGIPNGGTVISFGLAVEVDSGFGFVEFREVSGQGRKDKEFFLGRHEIFPGSIVAIGEDICNNFSSTDKVITLIENAGASIGAIICGVNRSMEHDSHYKGIPIISAIRKPFAEYEQTDPVVIHDIERGNVVWKPKDKWDELMLAMTSNNPSL